MAYYNCLLFDVDDTLLDFKAAETESLTQTFENFDIPITTNTFELYQKINSSLWTALEKGELRKDRLVIKRFEQLLKELNLSGSPGQLNEYYLQQLSEKAIPYPEAEMVLKNLSEVATIAIVSNGVEKVQKKRLERSGLLPIIDEIFVSEKMGISKPNRRFFENALQKLGIENKEKVLVVGDSLKADIQGGNSANLATCWYNAKHLENTTRVQPKYQIHTLSELYKIVMEQEEFDDIGSSTKRHLF